MAVVTGFWQMHGKLHGLPKKVLKFSIIIAYCQIFGIIVASQYVHPLTLEKNFMTPHRFFSCCLVSLFALTLLVLPSTLRAAEWYKGNLHMHSFWSDGNVYPEQAVDWYKDHGYHFVCLSDHNVLQLDPQKWINVGTTDHWLALFDKYVERYGQPETREADGKKQVRLSTIHELTKRLNVPGKFLMIPGHEMNSHANGVTLHANAINVTATIPFQRGETLAESIDKNALAVKKNGEEHGHTSLFMLNHPIWPYYDIDPMSMVEAKETILYESLNAGGHVAGNFDASPRFWNRETIWDIVTAFRITKGYPLMYGAGTDDTHDYTHIHDGNDSNPGMAWVWVRAEKLEPEAIVKALMRGDFYTSNGVELEKVNFDKATSTLSVKVKPVDGVKYRIQFIGTKKGFDQTSVPFTVEKGDRNPARKGWTFSEEIGIELAAVEGLEASYKLKDDDLYVRAVISSDQKREIYSVGAPRVSTAWTQPFCP